MEKTRSKKAAASERQRKNTYGWVRREEARARVRTKEMRCGRGYKGGETARRRNSWTPEQSREQAAAQRLGPGSAARLQRWRGLHARQAPKASEASDRAFKAPVKATSSFAFAWLRFCGSRYSIAAACSAARARSLRPGQVPTRSLHTVRHAASWGCRWTLQASTLVYSVEAGDWRGCSVGCKRLAPGT